MLFRAEIAAEWNTEITAQYGSKMLDLLSSKFYAVFLALRSC